VCCITADPHRNSVTRTPATDAIYPTKSQPFSIIWEDNTDSVVDLRVGCSNLCGTLSRAFTSLPPRPPPRRPTEPAPLWHGGIQWSCSPLFFLLSPRPTGSRTASTCRRSCFGKSGPGRWHLRWSALHSRRPRGSVCACLLLQISSPVWRGWYARLMLQFFGVLAICCCLLHRDSTGAYGITQINSGVIRFSEPDDPRILPSPQVGLDLFVQHNINSLNPKRRVFPIHWP
jgi:hypothetical protein